MTINNEFSYDVFGKNELQAKISDKVNSSWPEHLNQLKLEQRNQKKQTNKFFWK